MVIGLVNQNALLPVILVFLTTRFEENILFKMADKVLSNQMQDDVYKQFEKIEEEAVGHGVHEQFHELLNQLKSKYIVSV
jgi:hemerythrin-like domain-containing protein